MSTFKGLVILLLVLVTVQSMRVSIENIDAAHTDNAEAVEKCSASTCSSFDEGASCSCTPYLGTDEFQKSLESKLYDIVQRVRKVVDKLTPDSGTFSKLWWGGALGDAQQGMLLLEESLEKVPALQKLVDTPVKNISPDNFELPAGTWPLMVEVWDENSLSRNIFIGETGVPFKEGEHDYELPLRTNDYQWSVPPNGAKVSFSTSVTKSRPFDCDIEGMKRCVEFAVKVTCRSASNLPNTDSGILGDVTDAYCKVRVQDQTSAASQKLKSDVIYNVLNPQFDATFEIAPFKQPLVDPVPLTDEPDPTDPDEGQLVPYTIDEMTLSEQLTTNMYYLASKVYLDSERCKPEHSYVPAFCRLIQGLGSFAVDKAALEELAKTETDPTAKKMAERLVESSKTGSLAQVADLSASLVELASGRRVGHGAAVMAGVRAARRRNGGGGRRRSSGGGDAGGAGWVLFGMICFIGVLCMIA